MIKIKQNMTKYIKLIVALSLTLSVFGCDVFKWTEGVKCKDAEEITSFDTWIAIDVSFSEKWYYVTGYNVDEFQWSDTSEGGFGLPTGDIKVTILKKDGWSSDTDIDNGYNYPLEFENSYYNYDEKTYIGIKSNSNGVVYIRVNNSSSW